MVSWARGLGCFLVRCLLIFRKCARMLTRELPNLWRVRFSEWKVTRAWIGGTINLHVKETKYKACEWETQTWRPTIRVERRFLEFSRLYSTPSHLVHALQKWRELPLEALFYYKEFLKTRKYKETWIAYTFEQSHVLPKLWHGEPAPVRRGGRHVFKGDSFKGSVGYTQRQFQWSHLAVSCFV